MQKRRQQQRLLAKEVSVDTTRLEAFSDEGSQRKRLTTAGAIDGEQYQFHIN